MKWKCSVVMLAMWVVGYRGIAAAATEATPAATNATAFSAQNSGAVDVIEGWRRMKFAYDIQHPYDLDLKERYKYDSTTDTHDFWVFFADKPHAPPPNKTTARTEMRLETFTSGEHMLDVDMNVRPGTFACIAQAFDEARGPVTMVIAHPDGTVTVGHDVIVTNAIDRWWNLKITNDPSHGGKIHVYVDNKLVGTYASRGPRAYYFKCGVYSRKGSQRSEVWCRNIKMWVRGEEAAQRSEEPTSSLKSK
jgi:hypothetical protein